MIQNFIHPNAQLAPDVKVGAFSFIDDDVVIGKGTIIEPNVTIYSGSRIGENCRIFPGAVIGAIPQDLKFNGEYTQVVIGDRTTIRECATINRGTSAYGTTKIGSDTLIMAYVHIAHDCIIGNHCVFSNATNLAGHVEVEDYAIFGGMSAAHQFVKVGKHAFIAGGTMLSKDVPPYILVAKNPAIFGGINSVGLKRRDFTIEQIHSIQDIYRYLYNNGLNTTQAIRKIEEDFEDSDIKQDILRFVSQSERGIVKGIN